MEVNSKCEFCQHQDEDLIHALFLCPNVRYCWNSFLRVDGIDQCQGFDHFIPYYLELVGVEKQMDIRETLHDPRRAIEQGMSIQTLFTECATSLLKELNKARCWRPPNLDTFKFNTDGTTFFINR